MLYIQIRNPGMLGMENPSVNSPILGPENYIYL